ncbi:hypothetical protein QVD17_29544 [Tagetes erecta]|uniref:Uncharacterized protein n=1 Tax=Tagetes erecta TaxID=13708 RepID=A0AAD8KC99_TARER|nr:hypothetical protein QVD17_29544 [Tagetes erecta]
MNGLCRLLYDCGMYADHVSIKNMLRKKVQDQILLKLRKWLLTLQSQNVDKYIGTWGWQLLNLIRYDHGMEVFWLAKMFWIEMGVWICLIWLLLWSRHGIFTLKNSPSVEVRVEIFMSLRILEWHCHFEGSRKKSNMFELQLTFQSQLDGFLVDDVLKSWINYGVDGFEGLKILKKRMLTIKWVIMKILMMNGLMNKQELTLKSQLSVMKEIGSEYYFDNIEWLDCCLIHNISSGVWADVSERLGCSMDMGSSYGVDERIGANGLLG